MNHTFKSDVLFKMVFVMHPHLLKRLVSVLLAIPLQSITNFQITNTEMPPEEIGKKFCRLDIAMKVNSTHVNIEIQIENESNYLDRIIFYGAKMLASALPAGEDYSKLPKTIVISILGFNQFNGPQVHSEFALMEVTRHEILSDKQRYHFFELPKLPNIHHIDTTSEKDLWLALFNAETEEELTHLTKTGGEVMTQAVQAYKGITATEEFKNLERLRQRAAHDEAWRIGNARRNTIKQMIQAAIESSIPVDLIRSMCAKAGADELLIQELLPLQ